jgi:uncharacterized pyridoxamine 5'-phosphate oxidase family protein
MQKALDFLNANRDLAFATVDGDRPKLRVFQIMLIRGTDLFFATSARKEVYRQLRANPHVELLAMKGDLSVRVVGEAVFDVDDATAQAVYSGSPILQRLYADYRAMEYFRVRITATDYYDLRPTPPLLEHHEL